jgi:superfamily II DNA or RNA helicase
MISYIYVRTHLSYDYYNLCKLGKTNNIPERDSQYATGEIKRGCFEIVYEVDIKIVSIIERLLQNEFCELNVKYDAGTEFYDKMIISYIEPYFIKLGIKYKKLSKTDINNLVRCNRIKLIMKKINIKLLIQLLKNKINILYTPRKDQLIIIEKSITYFKEHNKGLLIIPCGVGKTLISLWISQHLNKNTVIIGIPNKLLLKQWHNIICILFKNIPILIVSGGVCIEDIMRFLRANKKCFVITTYASCHKVYTATQNFSFAFDMKINDEAHHLTSINMKLENTTKEYIQMLNIPSILQLSLTATIKEIDNNYSNNIIANNSIEYFGEIIDRKCLLWAIENNIICDYQIQSVITDEVEFKIHNIITKIDKMLFLSAYSALKSIFDNNTHHILIYLNNKENSLKVVEYIKLLLNDIYFDLPNLYYSNYHGEMNPTNQKQILNNFEKAQNGIITCVYCLGEGWDFPLLDGVVFAENMTSNIRIVQCALRASRKNKNEPNKITKIILPILNYENWFEDNDNADLKKVRQVIYHMGLEDETITQKIKVFKINIEKHKSNHSNKNETINGDFGKYDETLTEKLRLQTINRNTLGITYEKAKKIIASKNIKNKEEYYELCKMDSRLSNYPEIIFKGKFTNWIEYLSIDRVYYNLETCKNKVGEYLLINKIKKHHLDLASISNELCNLDPLFPPNGLWVEYYNIKDLQDIINTTNKKKF